MMGAYVFDRQTGQRIKFGLDVIIRVVIVVGAGVRAFLLPLAPFGFPLAWLRTFFFFSGLHNSSTKVTIVKHIGT